jgi:CBS domain containing-hemolysin-like protein
MVLGVVLVVLLIALNAFFVAAEFAIIKVRYSAVETDVAGGSSIAKSAQQVLDKLDKYLSAAQIGITLASLALGWLGEPVVAEILVSGASVLGLPLSSELAHKIAIPIGFVIITVLHLIFGEAVPKYAAIYYPQEFASRVCGYHIPSSRDY